MSDKTEYHQLYDGNTVLIMRTQSFRFPESSLEIYLLIVSGITDTTQTIFSLDRLSPIRLRKNLTHPPTLLVK